MNTTELIAALKIKGSFPTSDDLFSTSDFLVLLNHQMKTEIIPVMMLLSEEYFLLSKDNTISTAGASYRIPSRAIGAKLRDLKYVDANGNLTSLPRLFEEDRPQNLTGYYMVRNSVELSDGFTSGTLRMKYFGRPNDLVSTTACGQITSINTGSNQVTVSSLPSTMSDGVECDFVQNKNPYDLLDYDNAIVGVSGTTVTMTSLPAGLAVGDWLCLAEESPVPMVPEELHPVLVQSALVSALSSKKDKATDFEAKVLERIKQDAIRMLDPRVENDSVSFRSGRLLGYFSNRWY
jgi:hypothetical protein